jgi:hypothetical protein
VSQERDLPDTPVDLTKFRQVKQWLQTLQEEFSGTEETNEMDQIRKHVDALQGLLNATACDVSTPFSQPKAMMCRSLDFPMYLYWVDDSN